jgi:hypothetical protein
VLKASIGGSHLTEVQCKLPSRQIPRQRHDGILHSV